MPNFKLMPFQDEFIFSKARFPAFVGGVGCGKSLALILRALLLSEKYPDSLGLIVRREVVDLMDSTMKDFVRYTGLNINSRKEAILPNGSTIMFRHASETSVLKNLNLIMRGLLHYM